MRSPVIGYVFDRDGKYQYKWMFEGTMKNMASFIMTHADSDTMITDMGDRPLVTSMRGGWLDRVCNSEFRKELMRELEPLQNYIKEVRIKLVSNDPIIDYPIAKPEDAIVVMQSIIGDMANEYFAAVYLNTKNKPLDFMVVNIAGTDYSRMDPSTVIKGALLQNSPKIILFHNHPSGEITPSKADLASTQKMILAAKLSGISILDHVIISGDKFYSFAENGEIELNSSEYLIGLKELRELSTEEFNRRYSFMENESDIINSCITI